MSTIFTKIVLWETAENIPLFLGFILAVRARAAGDLPLALLFLTSGTVAGAILIHLTETRKYSRQPTIKESLVNLGVFTSLSLLFLFYYSPTPVWWSNGVTDIVLGTAVGAATALGESLGWQSRAGLKKHALALALVSSVVLATIRYIYSLDSLLVIFAAGIALSLAASIVIVRLDYWPPPSPDSTSRLASGLNPSQSGES